MRAAGHLDLLEVARVLHVPSREGHQAQRQGDRDGVERAQGEDRHPLARSHAVACGSFREETIVKSRFQLQITLHTVTRGALDVTVAV